jgi:hypothetical protein
LITDEDPFEETEQKLSRELIPQSELMSELHACKNDIISLLKDQLDKCEKREAIRLPMAVPTILPGQTLAPAMEVAPAAPSAPLIPPTAPEAKVLTEEEREEMRKRREAKQKQQEAAAEKPAGPPGIGEVASAVAEAARKRRERLGLAEGSGLVKSVKGSSLIFYDMRKPYAEPFVGDPAIYPAPEYGELYKKVRIPESYSAKAKEAMGVLAINKSKVRPFGSAVYKAQPFPGDLDLEETVELCCSPEAAALKMAGYLTKITQKVLNQSGYFFSEIKAGLDHAYDWNLGYLQNGQFFEFDPNEIRQENEDLYQAGISDDKFYNEVKDLLMSKMTIDNYNVLKELLRQKQVLRWDAKEILQGYKELSAGRKVSLPKALLDKTMVKIDVLAPLEGRYMEVTNFFVVEVYDEDGKKIGNLNLEGDRGQNFEKNIKENIEKLYYNKVFFNPFKMAKRIWSTARAQNDNKILKIFTPLIRSNISLLYQIKSDIDVLMTMMEKAEGVIPQEFIRKELSNMKGRLANVVQFKIPSAVWYRTLDGFRKVLEVPLTLRTREKLGALLKMFKTKLSEVIEKETIKYLNSYNMLPPPRNYLPDIMEYRYN